MADDGSRPPQDSGLARCPACGTHVRLEPVWQETVCIGCGVPLGASQREARGVAAQSSSLLDAFRGLARRSRSGIVAASLLGLSTLGAGCDDRAVGGDAGADGGVADARSSDAQRSDGQRADLNVSPPPDLGRQDVGPVLPPYGIPPDMSLPQPLYGQVPAPWQKGEPRDSDDGE